MLPCVPGEFSFIFQPNQKCTPQANLDANFEDRNAFVIGMAKFGEEAAVQSTLNETLEKGQRHAVNHDDNDNYQRSRQAMAIVQYNTKGDALHLAELFSSDSPAKG